MGIRSVQDGKQATAAGHFRSNLLQHLLNIAGGIEISVQQQAGTISCFRWQLQFVDRPGN